MVEFPCHCGYRFSVPDDMAGRQVQCPQCSRLNDVPTLDDLRALTEDGTYRIDDPKSEESKFPDLQQVYTRDILHDADSHVDFRGPAVPPDVQDKIVPFAPEAEGATPVPKYDPETGELIRPLPVRTSENDPPPPQEIPIARATLGYATPGGHLSGGSLFTPLVKILAPENLTTIFFVVLAHFFLQATIFVLALGVLLVAPMTFVLAGGLIAHYANVIEDIGLEERDELPRFLRHFSLGDDVWRPFVNTMLAALCCFGPALFTMMLWHGSDDARHLTWFVLLIFGVIAFPAALLTATTSGTILNMRPDRVLSTAVIIGPKYLLMIAVFVVACCAYLMGLGGETLVMANFIGSGGVVRQGFLVYTLILLVGIYLMHYFAWLLGLAYRASHDDFPWLFQRHVRTTPRPPSPHPPRANPITRQPRNPSAIHRPSGS